MITTTIPIPKGDVAPSLISALEKVGAEAVAHIHAGQWTVTATYEKQDADTVGQQLALFEGAVG